MYLYTILKQISYICLRFYVVLYKYKYIWCVTINNQLADQLYVTFIVSYLLFIYCYFWTVFTTFTRGYVLSLLILFWFAFASICMSIQYAVVIETYKERDEFYCFAPQFSLHKLKDNLFHNLSQIGLWNRKNHVLLHIWTRLFTRE